RVAVKRGSGVASLLLFVVMECDGGDGRAGVTSGGCGRDEGKGDVEWWLSWSSSRGGGGCGRDGVVMTRWRWWRGGSDDGDDVGDDLDTAAGGRNLAGKEREVPKCLEREKRCICVEARLTNEKTLDD
ncbi:hypothetical protein Tco_0221274, partial [Tanacetum coccineum]